MNRVKTIGIAGGGQLGRMLTEAAHKLGFGVVVLDPSPYSPAGQVADRQIVGSFKDEKNLRQLARQSDFITFEIEGVNDKVLEKILKGGKPVNPDPKILRIIRDKFKQKVFLLDNDIPAANFALIKNKADADKQGKIFGYPFLLKSRFDAYDGRGNFLVKKKADIPKAFEKLKESPLYAEQFVPFTKELAGVVARDSFGKTFAYPIVETVHKNNICHIVRSPAKLPQKTEAAAKKLAQKVLTELGGVGVFAVEMFLTKKGEVLVNEIAPRVHNSGHLTIEAYTASQFDLHIRAIAGLPLEAPKTRSRAAVMINILGKRNGPANFKVKNGPKMPKDVKIHIYGKMETRKERKMGHLTATGKTLKEAEKKAKMVRKHIFI